MTKLGDDVYYIPGGTNIGVVIDREESKNNVILIDTGGSELDGDIILSKLNSFFNSAGETFSVKAIYNTHSHADHTGGNASIKKSTGCEIYIPFMEQGSVENCLLQSSIIWGGYPPKSLRTVYYKVDYAEVTGNFNEETIINLSGNRKLFFVTLPGHYYETCAAIIQMPNGEKIAFSGDSLFTRGELSKFWIPFLINPKDFLSSIDKFIAIENIKTCVPGHGEIISENLLETAEMNKIAILSTRQCILETIAEGHFTTEEIIKKVADKNDITMKFSQFVLIGSTIRSYLSCLFDDGEITTEVQNNMLYWNIKK